MSQRRENKSYIKNGRGDRIHLKTNLHLARGGCKPQRSMEQFLAHLHRESEDLESLQSPHTVVALPRNGGKMAYMIKKALSEGGAIMVARKETKAAIMQTAAIMGVEAPKVVVAETKTPPSNLRGFTLSGVIVDI